VDKLQADYVAAASVASSTAETDAGNAVAISGTTATSSNLKFDAQGKPIRTGGVSPYISSVWYDTGKKALDLGVGAQGDLYITGVDKRVYFYDQVRNNLLEVEAKGGNDNLQGAVRISTSYDGTPFVITLTGETYYLSCDNRWIRLPGCATDISAGRGGEVYKTGCDAKSQGFGVYRLFCTCKSECCNNTCKRFRSISSIEQNNEEKKCHWFRFEGSGVKIAVAPNGWPYVVKNDNFIYSFNGADWLKISNLEARDISVSNEGILYAVGVDKHLYKLTDERHDSFEKISSVCEVESVSVGPFGLPFVIRSDGHLLSSSKTNFN
jgi:hypothetical protein